MGSARRIPALPIEEAERRRRRSTSPVPELWALLDAVADPEIPVASIWELGILQDVAMRDATVVVTLTPTYSGCPALDTIREDVRGALRGAGHTDVSIETRLAPAWSTSWMLESARTKLRDFGIAPPPDDALDVAPVRCPRCGSSDTRELSAFGATACKALHRCNACLEPFERFKAL